MLKGKTVLLGVTGGIAAYKAAALASALVKLRAAVELLAATAVVGVVCRALEKLSMIGGKRDASGN